MSEQDGGRTPHEMECPAGCCPLKIVVIDPDWMMGHLLTDHNWNFDTANQFFIDEWPDSDDWPPEEEVFPEMEVATDG